MTEVVADLEAGLLRLSRPALQALATLTAGPAAPLPVDPPAEATLGALESAGLVGPTGLHPVMAPIAAAVADPLVRIRFDHLGPGTPVECPGWISPDVAVLAVPGPDGLDEIVAVETSFLPARLAGLIGLGPRPGPRLPAGSVRADIGLLEALLSGLVASAEDVRRHVGPAVPQALVDAVVAISEGIRLHWRVATTWGGPARPTTRTHEVVESRAGTFWVVHRDFAGTALSPITPTGLWRLLIGLLPGDDEF
jgi:hypothetical protein